MPAGVIMSPPIACWIRPSSTRRVRCAGEIARLMNPLATRHSDECSAKVKSALVGIAFMVVPSIGIVAPCRVTRAHYFLIEDLSGTALSPTGAQRCLDDVDDESGVDAGENIIVAVIDPVIALGRRREMMSLPIDDVVKVAMGERKPLALLIAI